MMRVDLLRVMLPPARHLDASPVLCAWCLPNDVWHSARFEDLAAIAASYQPKRVEVCPHPGDVSMTQIELPPLPARRQRSAVLGAIELLTLASPKDIAVGFGPRSEQGMVSVAWMGSGVLSACLQALRGHGLPVHAVYPPPAFLPGPQEGVAAAAIVDDWVIVRTGDEEGTLYPVPAGCVGPMQIDARLQQSLPGSMPLHWLQGDEPVASWIGSSWHWALPASRNGAHEADRRWLRPALGWAVTAVAVWLVGLHLYASQVAAEGQALTRQMAAQVKAAYPDVAVVLNPLQQARQLRDAQRAGTGAVASADFSALVRASTGLLTQAAGQVQQLEFRDGQLQVRWREGATPSPDEMKSLREKSEERGLAVKAEDGGLRMQVVVAKKGDEAALRAAPVSKAAAPGAAR